MLALIAASYSITDIKLSPAKAFMNDAGMVAGKMIVEGGYRCFTWRNGRLNKLPEDIQEVDGLNSRGQLAVRTNRGVAVWFDGNIQFAKEPFLYAQSVGIDDNGRLTGWVPTGTEGAYSTVHFPAEQLKGIAPRPFAVASDGSFVGSYALGLQGGPITKPLSWLWDKGKETGIGDVERQAYATCISQNHHVGGYFQLNGNRYRKPFLWFEGMLTELPLPSGEKAQGTVVSINNQGHAVGEANWQAKQPDGIANLHLAVLWKDGKCLLLQDLVPKEADVEITKAFAINDKGEILAQIAPAKNHWPRSLAILKPSK